MRGHAEQEGHFILHVLEILTMVHDSAAAEIDVNTWW